MQLHSFGDWLKRRRKALDLTQAELADQVGCSAAAIRKIEAEERRPSAQIAERLAEIFNIPPQERTAFLRFARGDWRSAPSEIKAEFPWQVSAKSPRSNLPATVTSFVGREQEIVLVREYLLNPAIRLITLMGPPGIGKTRLSIESARTVLADFPNGVFFVALSPLTDPTLITAAIAQSLGYVTRKNISVSDQLKEGIGDKKLLLVLDNCEHLIEDISSFASELLSACPHLKLLATSREALRIPGEWIHSVPAFEVPKESSFVNMETLEKFPALKLFAERARAARSDFILNAENLPAITSICTQLDGLPLAIELIAARMRLMSPQALLERLNDRFILYADGMRAPSGRQKTLNDAIGWSYNLLSEEEQKVLAYLSVFSGGFTLEAAEAMFSSGFTKLLSDLVTSLLDKSLLQRAADRAVSRIANPTYTMLVTIQEFARERLREFGKETEVCNLHLEYFLDFAEQADQEIHGPNQLEWIDRVENELDNFRAALRWCVSDQRTESALILLTSLSDAWVRRDHSQEMHSWFNMIRSLPGIMDFPLIYARLLNHISEHSWILGDFDYAKSVLEESHAILVKLGIEGEPDLAMNLCWSGMVAHTGEADVKAARSFYERSFELYKKYGDQWGMAFVSFNSGVNADEWNDDVSALSLFEQSLEWFRQLGDIWGVARASHFLGQSFLKQGNYEKARIHFEEHLKIDEGLRFKQ
jgi:predicted ATPase/transcriptional regulator with XRE-family HTH domain